MIEDFNRMISGSEKHSCE